MRTQRRWYRRPRTTAEKRANQEGWNRPSRNPCNLVDTYDDIPNRSYRIKTWKDHRKTKYRNRGKRHELVVKNYKDTYKFEEYCETHNIPYFKWWNYVVLVTGEVPFLNICAVLDRIDNKLITPECASSYYWGPKVEECKVVLSKDEEKCKQ